jgi:anaerobic magnesium-protoporphyrin IX monomethyl ester cyclase
MPLSVLHLAAVLEGKRPWQIMDGNFDADLVATAVARVRATPHAMVGVTVMPGPQVETAIEVSAAIRQASPEVPIVWGGYFPTLYADAALNAPYVDVLVRGQGERPLLELLDVGARDEAALGGIRGISWKRDGLAVHNPEAPIVSPDSLPPLPYAGLGDVGRFLQPSCLGKRTAVHQGAIGCRYRCSFCGVASMWNGSTVLDAPTRVLEAGTKLRDEWGADSLQFFDHNFFDDEDSSLPMLDALATLRLPWWCYARADTLARFSTSTWAKIQRSQLRMAYVGAESGSDAALSEMKKGSRVEHTVEAVRRCREHGVIPELSFMIGGTEDPDAEVEPTFAFIRKLKAMHPEAEVVLYFYSPTPQRKRGVRDGSVRLPVLGSYGPSGPSLPTSPEEWLEPQWMRWVCHEDAPWLTERTRRRIHDFTRVLACRFPTVQDPRSKQLGRALLRNLARWRYATGRYDHPWELKAAQRLVRMRDPKTDSL